MSDFSMDMFDEFTTERAERNEKPAPVQSAEEFHADLHNQFSILFNPDIVGRRETEAYKKINQFIESRDAAQRQAGREEMLKECVELLNAHHKGLDSNGDQIYRIPIKALSDLGKARKG